MEKEAHSNYAVRGAGGGDQGFSRWSWEGFISVCLFVFGFLGLHPRHMDVPRLGVELELQLLPYATATATQDLSRIRDLHHRSRQCQLLNPLIKARD